MLMSREHSRTEPYSKSEGELMMSDRQDATRRLLARD